MYVTKNGAQKLQFMALSQMVKTYEETTVEIGYVQVQSLEEALKYGAMGEALKKKKLKTPIHTWSWPWSGKGGEDDQLKNPVDDIKLPKQKPGVSGMPAPTDPLPISGIPLPRLPIPVPGTPLPLPSENG